MPRHSRWVIAWTSAALAAAAAACGGPAPAASRTHTVYSAVERARSDSAAQLTASYSFDVDRRGYIYVADREAIRVLGTDGKLLRSIGRQGSGPGEFQHLLSVEVMAGDSLYAYDNGNGRATVFEPGTWRAAYTVQVGRDQHFAPYEVRRVRGGRIAGIFQMAYGDFDGRARHGRRKVVVRLLDADGSLHRDSVIAVPEMESLILHNPEAVGMNPFGRTTNIAFSGDRIVAAWSDSLKFDVYSIEGRHLSTIRPSFPVVRRPITPEERDSVVQSLSNSLIPAASVRRALDDHGATTWPLVQDMMVDDRDRIWVGITGSRGGPNHWVAFDHDGARVAEVDLPANMRMRLLRGTTAYAAALDENDVPQVVVFDLKPTQTLAMRRP
ncbi:MAG TPA: hypothetical protein VEX86_21855 [Longimicrobium sp.]|nr:hypothetical protein [Longimicrobium sp.]